MVVLVAGGISAVRDIHHIVGHLFCGFRHEVSFALLREDVGREGLSRAEIVSHGPGLDLLFALYEKGVAELLPYGVECISGVHDAAVHAHFYAFGLQFDVTILDVALAEEVGHVVPRHNDRIGGLIGDWRLEHALSAPRRVLPCRVDGRSKTLGSHFRAIDGRSALRGAHF